MVTVAKSLFGLIEQRKILYVGHVLQRRRGNCLENQYRPIHDTDPGSLDQVFKEDVK